MATSSATTTSPVDVFFTTEVLNRRRRTDRVKIRVHVDIRKSSANKSSSSSSDGSNPGWFNFYVKCRNSTTNASIPLVFAAISARNFRPQDAPFVTGNDGKLTVTMQLQSDLPATSVHISIQEAISGTSTEQKVQLAKSRKKPATSNKRKRSAISSSSPSSSKKNSSIKASALADGSSAMVIAMQDVRDCVREMKTDIVQCKDMLDRVVNAIESTGNKQPVLPPAKDPPIVYLDDMLVDLSSSSTLPSPATIAAKVAASSSSTTKGRSLLAAELERAMA